MRVKTKAKAGLAIDCRTNVYFEEDEVLEIGSKANGSFNGLSEGDLKELLTLNLAVDVSTETETETVAEVEADTDEPEIEEDGEELGETEGDPEPEYMSFTKKADLEQYAKETYSIDLDKRLTLKGMIEQLENELGGEL